MKKLLFILLFLPFMSKAQTTLQMDNFWANKQLRLLYDSVGNPVSDSILMWDPATKTVKAMAYSRLPSVNIYSNDGKINTGSHGGTRYVYGDSNNLYFDSLGIYSIQTPVFNLESLSFSTFFQARPGQILMTAPREEIDIFGGDGLYYEGDKPLYLNNVHGTSGQVLTSTGTGAPIWASGGGSSTTIYNGDGSLAGRRNINGNGYSLFFNSNDSFGVSSSAIYFNNIGTYGSVFYGDSTGVSSIGDRLNTHNGFIFTIKDQNDQAYIADATYGNGLLNVNGGSTANVQIGDAGNNVNGTLLTVSDHSKDISTRFTKYSDGLFSLQNRSGVFYLGDGGGDINNTDFSGNDSLGTADISAPNGLTLDANIIANNVPSSDTTTAKPMGIDGSGNVYQLPYWPSGTGGGGTPGGSTTQIQYNNGGAFAGSANLLWENSLPRLDIGAVSADPNLLGTSHVLITSTGYTSESLYTTNGGGGGYTFYGTPSATAFTGLNGASFGGTFGGTFLSHNNAFWIYNVGRSVGLQAATTVIGTMGGSDYQLQQTSSGAYIGLGSTIPHTNSDAFEVDGNVSLLTAGEKIKIAIGSNASIGTATLSGGTVTISTTAVTSSSKIFLTDATTGTLTNVGVLTVGTITAGTSFVVNSVNPLDTSNVNWWIIN